MLSSGTFRRGFWQVLALAYPAANMEAVSSCRTLSSSTQYSCCHYTYAKVSIFCVRLIFPTETVSVPGSRTPLPPHFPWVGHPISFGGSTNNKVLYLWIFFELSLHPLFLSKSLLGIQFSQQVWYYFEVTGSLFSYSSRLIRPRCPRNFSHDRCRILFSTRLTGRSVKLLRGAADKSLARPNSRCRRTESILSLERGGLFMCRIASLLLL